MIRSKVVPCGEVALGVVLGSLGEIGAMKVCAMRTSSPTKGAVNVRGQEPWLGLHLLLQGDPPV